MYPKICRSTCDNVDDNIAVAAMATKLGTVFHRHFNG